MSAATLQTPASKGKNALAKMMSAPKKSYNYGEFQENLEASSITSENWVELLDQSLAVQEQSLPRPDDATWAQIVANTIVQTAESCVISKLTVGENIVRTRLDALDALIAIATAVAFAPPGLVPDLVRESRVPSFLISNMYRILKSMSEYEIKRVISKKRFIVKVRELRHITGVCWNDQRWKDLDEVLRLVKDSSPINFRRCYEDIENILQLRRTGYSTKKETSDETIIKIIRNDISSLVTKSSCFESKYNAMNALSDFGILLLRDGVSNIVWGPLSSALCRVGKMMREVEADRIALELLAIREVPSPTFVNDFSGTASEMAILLQILIKTRAFKDKEPFKWRISRDLQQGHDVEELLRGFDEEPVKCDGQKQKLLAKILYLRWTRRASPTYDQWDPSSLDDVIDLFIDTSVPLACDRFLVNVDRALPKQYHSGGYGAEEAMRIRGSVHRAIVAVSKRIDYRACFETKRNAFRTLVKMGLRMLLYMKEQQTTGYRGTANKYSEYLRDEQTETLIISSLVRICQSLSNQELEDMLKEQTLLDEISELDQHKVPGMLRGLDAVLAVVRDPGSLHLPEQSKASNDKRLVDLTSDGVEVLDLTLTSGMEVVDLT